MNFSATMFVNRDLCPGRPSILISIVNSHEVVRMTLRNIILMVCAKNVKSSSLFFCILFGNKTDCFVEEISFSSKYANYLTIESGNAGYPQKKLTH